MKNKRNIMLFSALQILIFHLWIPITNSNLELFVKQTAYMGVDIFFLLSGYSLGLKKIENYARFVISRFNVVYVKFILFSLVFCLINNTGVIRFLKIISGVELFEKGGGAFLWFVPGIMIFYICYPLFQSCDNKNRIVTITVAIAIWGIVAYLFTWVKTYKHIFILWNRIPIFVIGHYWASLESTKNPMTQLLNKALIRLAAGLGFTVVGGIIAYKYCFRMKLQIPFVDTFYLVAIPFCIGLVLIVGCIKENRVSKTLGKITLEMYGIQMIFGFDFANKILLKTGNIVETNVLTVLFVVVASAMIYYGCKHISKLIFDKV